MRHDRGSIFVYLCLVEYLIRCSPRCLIGYLIIGCPSSPVSCSTSSPISCSSSSPISCSTSCPISCSTSSHSSSTSSHSCSTSSPLVVLQIFLPALMPVVLSVVPSYQSLFSSKKTFKGTVQPHKNIFKYVMLRTVTKMPQ